MRKAKEKYQTQTIFAALLTVCFVCVVAFSGCSLRQVMPHFNSGNNYGGDLQSVAYVRYTPGDNSADYICVKARGDVVETMDYVSYGRDNRVGTNSVALSQNEKEEMQLLMSQLDNCGYKYEYVTDDILEVSFSFDLTKKKNVEIIAKQFFDDIYQENILTSYSQLTSEYLQENDYRLAQEVTPQILYWLDDEFYSEQDDEGNIVVTYMQEDTEAYLNHVEFTVDPVEEGTNKNKLFVWQYGFPGSSNPPYVLIETKEPINDESFINDYGYYSTVCYATATVEYIGSVKITKYVFEQPTDILKEHIDSFVKSWNNDDDTFVSTYSEHSTDDESDGTDDISSLVEEYTV